MDHHKVDDTLWAEMRGLFSEAEIIELAAHTTLFIGFGRFNEIVGLEPATRCRQAPRRAALTPDRCPIQYNARMLGAPGSLAAPSSSA